MLPGALEAGYDCVRLVESGVEDQRDETMRPPPPGVVRASSVQDLYLIYTSFARIRCKGYSYFEGV